jgi:hypothetical protein
MPAGFDERVCVTCSAPNNIATIKYWGKASSKLNTPINSSVSVTLNQDDLKAITTAAASRSFASDRLWLNGEEESVENSSRLKAVFKGVRALAGDRVDPQTGKLRVWWWYWREMIMVLISPPTHGACWSRRGARQGERLGRHGNPRR